MIFILLRFTGSLMISGKGRGEYCIWKMCLDEEIFEYIFCKKMFQELLCKGRPYIVSSSRYHNKINGVILFHLFLCAHYTRLGR